MAGDGGRVPDVSEQRADRQWRDEWNEVASTGSIGQMTMVGDDLVDEVERLSGSDPASVLAAWLAESPEATVAALEALLTRDAILSRVPTPTRITIHHTATAAGPGAEIVEQIRRYHVEDRGWPTIAYHLLIDDGGVIWPGRPFSMAPDSHSDVDFAGHIAVAVLGNFEEEHPTVAAMSALRTVVATLQAAFEIPDENVGVHGDYADTACPGVHLRAACRSLRPKAPKEDG